MINRLVNPFCGIKKILDKMTDCGIVLGKEVFIMADTNNVTASMGICLFLITTKSGLFPLSEPFNWRLGLLNRWLLYAAEDKPVLFSSYFAAQLKNLSFKSEYNVLKNNSAETKKIFIEQDGLSYNIWGKDALHNSPLKNALEFYKGKSDKVLVVGDAQLSKRLLLAKHPYEGLQVDTIFWAKFPEDAFPCEQFKETELLDTPDFHCTERHNARFAEASNLYVMSSDGERRDNWIGSGVSMISRVGEPIVQGEIIFEVRKRTQTRDI